MDACLTLNQLEETINNYVSKDAEIASNAVKMLEYEREQNPNYFDNLLEIFKNSQQNQIRNASIVLIVSYLRNLIVLEGDIYFNQVAAMTEQLYYNVSEEYHLKQIQELILSLFKKSGCTWDRIINIILYFETDPSYFPRSVRILYDILQEIPAKKMLFQQVFDPISQTGLYSEDPFNFVFTTGITIILITKENNSDYIDQYLNKIIEFAPKSFEYQDNICSTYWKNVGFIPNDFPQKAELLNFAFEIMQDESPIFKEDFEKTRNKFMGYVYLNMALISFENFEKIFVFLYQIFLAEKDKKNLEINVISKLVNIASQKYDRLQLGDFIYKQIQYCLSQESNIIRSIGQYLIMKMSEQLPDLCDEFLIPDCMLMLERELDKNGFTDIVSILIKVIASSRLSSTVDFSGIFALILERALNSDSSNRRAYNCIFQMIISEYAEMSYAFSLIMEYIINQKNEIEMNDYVFDMLSIAISKVEIVQDKFIQFFSDYFDNKIAQGTLEDDEYLFFIELLKYEYSFFYDRIPSLMEIGFEDRSNDYCYLSLKYIVNTSPTLVRPYYMLIYKESYNEEEDQVKKEDAFNIFSYILLNDSEYVENSEIIKNKFLTLVYQSIDNGKRAMLYDISIGLKYLICLKGQHISKIKDYYSKIFLWFIRSEAEKDSVTFFNVVKGILSPKRRKLFEEEVFSLYLSLISQTINNKIMKASCSWFIKYLSDILGIVSKFDAGEFNQFDSFLKNIFIGFNNGIYQTLNDKLIYFFNGCLEKGLLAEEQKECVLNYIDIELGKFIENSGSGNIIFLTSYIQFLINCNDNELTERIEIILQIYKIISSSNSIVYKILDIALSDLLLKIYFINGSPIQNAQFDDLIISAISKFPRTYKSSNRVLVLLINNFAPINQQLQIATLRLFIKAYSLDHTYLLQRLAISDETINRIYGILHSQDPAFLYELIAEVLPEEPIKQQRIIDYLIETQ